MPRKRTSPSTPTVRPEDMDSSAQPLPESQPALAPNSPVKDYDTKSTRNKRNRDDNTALMEEMRSLVAQSDTKIAALQSAMNAIIPQTTKIKESIIFTSKQYNEVMLKLEYIESERTVARSYIQLLENKVEFLERQLNVTKVEIKNIPRNTEESKDDLRKIVIQTAEIIGTPVQLSDIKDIFRSGRRDDPAATIVVDFVSAIIKDTMIRKARQFNTRNNTNKLNSVHLKIDGPARPIYITEKLTAHGQSMHCLARKFARDNRYKHCWTSYGRTFLRKEDGGLYTHVDTEDDLINLQKY